MAESARRGESMAEGVRGVIPPLLAWLIVTGDRQGALPQALRCAATQQPLAARGFATVQSDLFKPSKFGGK